MNEHAAEKKRPKQSKAERKKAMQSSSSLFAVRALPPSPILSSRSTPRVPPRRLCQYPRSPTRASPAPALRAAASPDPPLSPFEDSAGAQAQGLLYSAQVYDLTPENVDRVLDEVRPYLISDGGNVDVVSVQDGVVTLQLQGACGSCPSSTTTMTMGIERVLKEKFGDALKDIRQVNDQLPSATTVEAVNNHLDILRPAIKNYGGSVEVLSVDGEDCLVKYVGPESIGSGIKAAIKERFQDIVNVVFTE